MTPDDRPDGLIRALLGLLAELDERGAHTRHGHWSGGRTSVDYSVSVGRLDDATRDDAPLDAASPAITTRPVEGGVVVVADLPNADGRDVSVDLDGAGRTARLRVDGDVVGEVPLEEDGWTVDDLSVNNDIVQVTLTHD